MTYEDEFALSQQKVIDAGWELVDGKTGLSRVEYAVARIAGELNDQHSTVRGIKIFLTKDCLSQLKIAAEYKEQHIEPTSITEDFSPLLSMVNLPEGVFKTLSGLYFCLHAEENYIHDPYQNLFNWVWTHYVNVVRVEGANGTLWQNFDHNWDGSLRATS